MKKIKKIIVDGNEVFLRKSGNNYRVVHPVRNEDGTFNWFNFITGGSWTNLIIIAVIVFLILGLLYEYSKNIETLLNCFNNIQSLEICKASFGKNLTTIQVP